MNNEMKLKKTELILFSMSESSKNIFLHHIGHIQDDICASYKKIQPGTNLTSKCFPFGGQNQKTYLCTPNTEMKLVQSFFNVRKYLNDNNRSHWSHKR